MDKLVNEKSCSYIHTMKSSFKELYKDKKIEELSKDELKSLTYQMINFMEDYSILEFNSSDFLKRKRVKNIVPQYDRCIAKIANMKQCTRRKKAKSDLCGTHLKGVPHGTLEDIDIGPKTTKVTVTAHDIKGIYYYLDDSGNVYDTADIVQGKNDPRVVAKYIKNQENGTLHIPEYNI